MRMMRAVRMKPISVHCGPSFQRKEGCQKLRMKEGAHCTETTKFINFLGKKDHHIFTNLIFGIGSYSR